MLPTPILCKITSNATGPGYYNARRQIRKRAVVFDPTTSLTMATYYQNINSHDDVYVVNNADAGGGHSLAANTYVWCEVAGPSTAATPRMVMSVLGGGGGTLSIGQYQGMGYVMLTDLQAGWSLPFLVPEP